MELKFKTNKLKKTCESPKKAQKIYGEEIGYKLTLRIGELKAAINLQDIKDIPSANLHRLKGKRSDEYAVNLAQPYRLVFKSILEESSDINDLESIDIVRIEEVIDYHGKQKRKK